MDRDTLLKEAVARHAQAVYNLALRVAGNPADAEDATQEAFAALAREAGKLREPGAVKTWLLRTALRGCWRTAEKDRHRRKAEKEVASMRAEEIQQGDDPGSWAPILRQAVDRLPEALRLPLLLRYEQGLSHAEIAEVAGCPVGSVSARLREGLGTLRKALPAALGIALAADAALEEALGAVPPEPVPAGLISAIQAAAVSSAAGISMATWGGAAMTIKKAALVTAAILLLIVGIWMALAPGRPPVQAARPGPAAAPVRLPAPEAAEVPRPSLPSPSQAPAPEGPAIAGQPAVLSGRVFDRRTNRPIRNAIVAWFAPGGPPAGAAGDTVSQAPVAASGDKVAEDEAIDGGGSFSVAGPDFITLTNAEGRYRLEIPPAWFSLGYNLKVVTTTFIPFKSPLCPPLGEPGERTQDIALSSGWTLRVSATSTADGRPVRLERARLFRRDLGDEMESDGRFKRMVGQEAWSETGDGPQEIRALDAEVDPPGLLGLKVEAKGYVRKSVSLAGIPLVDDVMTVAVQLQPFPPERQVHGRVLDPEGRPLGGVFIYCWPARMRWREAVQQDVLDGCATRKEDGSFRINPKAPEGDDLFSLWINDQSHGGDGLGGILRAPLIAKAGAEAILRLEAVEGTVSGRVLDAEGAPAAGAGVEAVFEGPEKERNLSYRRTAVTDAQGCFVLRGIPTGKTGTVTARAADPSAGRVGISISDEPPPRGWTGVAAGASDLEIRLGEGEALRPYRE